MDVAVNWFLHRLNVLSVVSKQFQTHGHGSFPFKQRIISVVVPWLTADTWWQLRIAFPPSVVVKFELWLVYINDRIWTPVEHKFSPCHVSFCTSNTVAPLKLMISPYCDWHSLCNWIPTWVRSVYRDPIHKNSPRSLSPAGERHTKVILYPIAFSKSLFKWLTEKPMLRIPRTSMFNDRSVPASPMSVEKIVVKVIAVVLWCTKSMVNGTYPVWLVSAMVVLFRAIPVFTHVRVRISVGSSRRSIRNEQSFIHSHYSSICWSKEISVCSLSVFYREEKEIKGYRSMRRMAMCWQQWKRRSIIIIGFSGFESIVWRH